MDDAHRSYDIISKMIPQQLFHCSIRPTAAVKWVPCYEVMLYSIPMSVKYTLCKPSILVLGKVLWAEKTNLYSEKEHTGSTEENFTHSVRAVEVVMGGKVTRMMARLSPSNKTF